MRSLFRAFPFLGALIVVGVLSEIESFFKRSHKVIVALTVQEILGEHIAKKLV